LADKVLGHRLAVLIGAILMTLGHASMAMETKFFFYTGLVLLVLGNGFFKPNISSIVGSLYADQSQKKDAAYTIFYMGINAGAFLGILLCGYIGEKIKWSFGFGLAGIFMFLGLMQFWLGQKIFSQKKEETTDPTKTHLPNDPIETFDALEDTDPKTEESLSPSIVKDRLKVIVIFAFFSIFFWMAFEQAGGSMAIFAKDYTDRILENGAGIFKLINTLITVLPLIVISWVVILLIRKTFHLIPYSNFFLGLSFIIIWYIALYMLSAEYNAQVTEVQATWFQILNSFFIITFAPLFSRIWESKLNPLAAFKFGLGLILLGLGFAALSYGSMPIPKGAETASVSMIWLILAFWLHTMGELCVSPVGLSYVSKLSPPRLVGIMFGVWFGTTAIANYLAHFTGSFIDKITQKYSLSGFFLIYTIIPIVAGLIIIMLKNYIKKNMHGVE
jgi:POT family proton-dependent oligopeptide transporter